MNNVFSNRQYGPLSPNDVAFAFLAGLCGELYLPLPGLGVIAMTDIVAYVLAFPLFVYCWPRMGYYSKRAVGWGLAWMVAAVVSNAITFSTMWYFWACIAVVASGWTLTMLLWVIFKSDARNFLWFLMGYGIGCVIGMYYFQNGAYLGFMYKAGIQGVEGLVEKQIYPNYAKAIVLFGGLFTCMMAGSLFSLFSSILTIVSGIWMLFHGGARSTFGAFLASGLFGFAVIATPRLIQALFRRTVAIVVVGLIGAIAIFSIYAHLAKSGRLGEGEFIKFEQEEEINEEFGESRISARGGYMATWKVFKKKPWGEGGKLRRHSVISNSWNCEGLVGLLFWLYYFGMVLWFFRNRIPFSGKFAPFFVLFIILNIWDIIGSPFGSRHKFFGLLAFIALCRDNPMYGVPEVFGHPETRR